LSPQPITQATRSNRQLRKAHDRAKKVADLEQRRSVFNGEVFLILRRYDAEIDNYKKILNAALFSKYEYKRCVELKKTLENKRLSRFNQNNKTEFQKLNKKFNDTNSQVMRKQFVFHLYLIGFLILSVIQIYRACCVPDKLMCLAWAFISCIINFNAPMFNIGAELAIYINTGCLISAVKSFASIVISVYMWL
jgi:hypothetical protein